MQGLVALECEGRGPRPYRVLEIGSWAGGSAITWADAIKRFNRGEGMVVCVDPWVQYIDPLADGRTVYREMHEALAHGEILDLFRHNIRACGHEDLVRMIRGSSDEILPLIKPETFDLVFVDGDHSYGQVLDDLRNAAPLVRPGGILCGDDLELQLAEVDAENCIQRSDSDFTTDPQSNRSYHPGVTRAVAEFFGEVSVWEGFWAMRRQGAGWEPLPSNGLGPAIEIPQHLLPTHHSASR
jgi:predicted O-methyltransferase YrrM